MNISPKAQLLNGTGRSLPMLVPAILAGWNPNPVQAEVPVVGHKPPKVFDLTPPSVSMARKSMANCDDCGGYGYIIAGEHKLDCEGCAGKGVVYA